MPSTKRQFLKGLGGFTLGLPFLPSLLPSTVRAQPSAPKRFVAVCTWDGFFEPVYYPTVDADRKVADDVYYKPLSEITGNISEAFGSAFEGLKPKMNLIRGLDVVGSTGHATTNQLCGTNAAQENGMSLAAPAYPTKSIDVVLSRSKGFYPAQPEFLALRGQEPSYNYSMSFDLDSNNKSIRIPYAMKPVELFQAVFARRILDPAVRDRFKSHQLKIGDLVQRDLQAKLASRRLSAEDRQTLQNLVEQMQQVHSRIASSQPVSCNAPAAPAATGSWDGLSDADKARFFSTYIDLMVTAMACGLTRISMLAIRLWGHDHGLSHQSIFDRNNQLKYITNIGKVVGVVAEMATKMNSFMDPNGKTMLDNSIVFWGSEQGEGQGHRCESMPIVTFGSAGGAIKTGNYVDYRQRPFFRIANQKQYPAVGRSYTQFLITVMRALGVEPQEYMALGDGGGYGRFNRDVNYSEKRYYPYEQQRNATLPFVSNV